MDMLRLVVAFQRLAFAESKRVSLFIEIPWPFKWLYRAYWLAVAGLIIRYWTPLPGEAFVYFPAMLAVASAWLFTAPAFGQALLDRDYRDFELAAGAFPV